MSTRNTVSSMAMGQGTGTAAALCVKKNCAARDLSYTELRDALLQGGVYLESLSPILIIKPVQFNFIVKYSNSNNCKGKYFVTRF